MTYFDDTTAAPAGDQPAPVAPAADDASADTAAPAEAGAAAPAEGGESQAA